MTICDVETHRSVQHFVGHTASIKSLSWNPSNDGMFASTVFIAPNLIYSQQLSRALEEMVTSAFGT
jgi:hypothetical protein